jgi:hypothetical protein
MRKVLEKDIETKLYNGCKRLGLTALKLNLMGRRSWPDRMIILPHGMVDFIELKAPGKVPTPKQKAVHEQLKDLNHRILVIDTIKGVDKYLADLKEWLKE